MTNCNYTQLSNQQIISIIDGFNKSPFQIIKYIKGHQTDLYQEILNRTKFLDDGFYEKNNVPLQARIHCIRNDIHEHPRCQNINCVNHNLVEWRFGKTNSFATYCSLKCAQSDKVMKDKKVNTCQSRFGVDNPFQSKEVKQKIIQTCIDKYGTSNCMTLDWVKDKIRQTNLVKYGVECVLQNEEIKERIKLTCMERYGVEHGGASEHAKQKYIQTCQYKWGVNNAFQADEVKQKIEQTCMERYGVRNIMQLDYVKEKVLEGYRQEMLRKYGVRHFSQTSYFHQKIHKPYVNDKYQGMTFGSSWEFKVYDFLMGHGIEFEYQPSIHFDYYVDGEHHTYHPDFMVGNKIIEVKGDHFFRINETTGKEEMYCPWRDINMSDEEYDKRCRSSEEKYKCMLMNGVIILRKNNIMDLYSSLMGTVNTPPKPLPPQQGM